tara:strand:+ start:1072 stop:1371 length:300 start_codon:yes stop_codon:yes gene_type:complete
MIVILKNIEFVEFTSKGKWGNTTLVQTGVCKQTGIDYYRMRIHYPSGKLAGEMYSKELNTLRECGQLMLHHKALSEDFCLNKDFMKRFWEINNNTFEMT